MTWIENLWDRKVPQYLGTYLAVGFGLLQFLEFITSRYNLGANFVDKYLLVWLALLPAIAIYGYYSHEFKSSTNKSRLKWPKLIIIFNVVTALLLGALLFNGSAEIQSEIIEVTDEEGKNIRAVVPSINKVKSIAIFQFENLTEDNNLDWWGIAFSTLLSYDLEQRPEYYTYSSYGLNGYYDRLGLASFEIPSIGMQREVAQKSRNDYFTRISYRIKDNSFAFKGNLYRSRDGKPIIEINIVDNDPYHAIDMIKDQIVKNIPNAFQQTESQIDLPASTLISSNQEALRYFTNSRLAYFKNPTGLDEVVALAKKSVALDPSCAVCHFYVGDPLYGQGKRDEALESIKSAIKYGVALPDRMQFGPKSVLYSITNRVDAYIKLQEAQRRMFPYNFNSYQQLLSVYKLNYGIDSAKYLMQEAIDNGNIEKGLLEMFDLLLENEEFSEAEKTLDRFEKEFPDRDQERLRYSQLYEAQGKIGKAKDYLLEEETMDPFNAAIQTRIAYIDFKNLETAKAFTRIELGIQQSTSLSDSIAYLAFKQFFLQKMGRIGEAFVTVKEYERLALKRTPLNRVVLQNFNMKADMYLSTGKAEKVAVLLNEIDKYSPEFRSRYECSVFINVLERDYPINFTDEEFLGCREVYAATGNGFEEYIDLMISYQKGDYASCAKVIEASDEKLKKLLAYKGFLSSIYKKAGQQEKAVEVLTKAIDQKTDDPTYYYEIAVLLEETDPKAAKENLEKALLFWSQADGNYIPFLRANELADRLAL